jgi:HAE1 family hydrophobic/amphiphilic exporter-1
MAAVQAEARAIVNSMELPPGISIRVGTQQRYQDEMLASLGLAFGLSVLFVYMILASQFGSFVHPFTIMLALPFSVVGALLALFISHFNFDMLAAIGLILLMGLVTKNSILLVDFTNQLRRRGYAVREAILEAGPIRLRPILMTTLSMICGMLPVAFGLGAGSELRRPMGMAVIGGLITSTLLTLVVVPVVYSLIAGLSRRVTGSSADVTSAQTLDEAETERLEIAAGSVR